MKIRLKYTSWELSDELQKRLLTNPNIEDMALVIENRNELVERNEEISRLLNENDHEIFQNELRWFALKSDKIEKRYSISDMRRLLKELNDPSKEADIDYEPQRPAVKSIWRKIEQKYLRDYTKDYMREHLAKGYVSILCMDGSENGGIYQLLKKAVNPCIRRIEIYLMGEVTNEIQQVIDFLHDIKDVAFKSEI